MSSTTSEFKDNQMISLYHYAQETYNRIRMGEGVLNSAARKIVVEKSFDEMISNDELCINLIQAVLDFNSPLVKANRNRASHIIVTWLLGIDLGKRLGTDCVDGEFANRNYYRLWLQSAMLHDYGYFVKEISEDLNSIDDILKPYSLLEDKYDPEFLKCLNDMRNSDEFSGFFSYEYDEIRNYFRYSQDYHRNMKKNAGSEKNDHGIIGGCIAFNKYCKSLKRHKIKEDSENTRIQKIACIIAASHNIFKSGNAETDTKYMEYGLDNLLSTSSVRINDSNKLLLLLSLVDTIECTKRFSAKENRKEFLQQKTTLKYVGISFEDNKISLDFSGLYDYVAYVRKSENMMRKIEEHVDAIVGMGSWTIMYTSKPDLKNKFMVCIEYQPE